MCQRARARTSGTDDMKKAKHGQHAASAERELAKDSAKSTGAKADKAAKAMKATKASKTSATSAKPVKGAAPATGVAGKAFVMPERGKKQQKQQKQASSHSGKDQAHASAVGGTSAALSAEPFKQVEVGESVRSRTPLKVFGIVLGVIVAVVALVYVAGAVVFMGRFFPNTVVRGTDISLKTPEEVQQLLENSVENYSLSVSGLGFSLDLTAQEAGLALDGLTIAQSMMKDVDPWRWPFEIMEVHDQTEALLATYNQGGLDEVVRAAVDEFNKQAEAPQDACVAFDEKKGQFAIVPGEGGTALSADAVIALVDEALVALNEKAEVTSEQLAQPNVVESDPLIIQATATANGLILVNVDFTLAGTTAVTLDASVVSQWVVIGKDLSVVLDEAAMGDWVDETVDSCSTYQTEREYTRPDGKKVTVSGGSYGWSVDGDAFSALVRQAIEADQVGSVEIPCTRTADAFDGAGGRDWGNRYVDIDLSEQYARFYDDAGELIWESAIVSGALRNGTSLTPTGVYAITDKASPSVLRGRNEDGSEYESKVSYWMPFVGNAIGLHDATWQSSFGGTRWKDGAGSHGCVNLPLENAKTLYGLIEWNDVVVVHW